MRDSAMKTLLMYFLFPMALAACANPIYAPEADATGNGRQGSELVCNASFKAGQCVSMTWQKMPTEEEFGSFDFRIYRTVDGGKVLEDVPGLHVMLWMPGMGHGSSPITLERLETGTYRASRVFFSMRGEWEIRFQQKEGATLRDQAILRVDF